jgi:hypothetical protein
MRTLLKDNPQVERVVGKGLNKDGTPKHHHVTMRVSESVGQAALLTMTARPLKDTKLVKKPKRSLKDRLGTVGKVTPKVTHGALTP